MTVLCPDVSEYQSGSTAPDWAGIKRQNGGAGIIRVSYGSGHLDTMFAANYTAMKSNKYSFTGVYQYLRAGQDAVAQAAAFCSWIGPPSAVAPGTVFICDLEEGAGDQSGRANAWLGTVDRFYGLDKLPLSQRSWLYSYTSFVTAHNLGGIFASARRTWIAAYQNTEPVIGHTLWQSTDGTNGSHITNWAGCGRVNTSYYPGTLAALASTGWQQQDTPPRPPPQPPPSPTAPQPEEPAMIRACDKTTAVAFASGAYSWIAFFSDPGLESKGDQAIRVAAWSPDGGGTFAVTNVTVGPSAEKVTVALPARCAGLGISRPGQDPDGTIWAPVAWNLG